MGAQVAFAVLRVIGLRSPWAGTGQSIEMLRTVSTSARIPGLKVALTVVWISCPLPLIWFQPGTVWAGYLVGRE